MKRILQQKSNFLNSYFSNQTLFFFAVLFISFLPIFSGQIFADKQTFLFGITINYLQIRITLHDILAILFLLAYLGNKRIRYKRFLKVIFPLLAIIIYSGLAAYYSASSFSDNEIIYAGASSLTLAQFFLNSFAILLALKILITKNIKKNIKYITLGITISTILQLILGLIQIYTRDSIFPELLSWTGQPLKLTSHTYIGIARWARAYGTTPHPNILGGIATLFLFILLSQNMKVTNKLLYSIPIMALVIITFSRAAILSSIAILIIYLIKKLIKSFPQKLFTNKYLMSYLIALQVIIISITHISLRKINYTYTFLVSRSIIQHAYQLLVNFKPTLLLFGTGYKMSIPVLLYNRLNLGISLIYQNRLLSEPLHNIFLLSIVELGIPLMLISGIIYIKLISYLFRDLGKWQKLSLLLFLIIIGGVDHWLFY